MDEQKEKQYKTEWSFSFDKAAGDIGEFVKSMGGEAKVKVGEFVEALGSAESAQVRLYPSVGETTVTMLNDSPNLIEANLNYIGDIKFVAEGDTEKIVSLSQVAGASEWFRNMFTWIGSNQKLRWNVGLTSAIPLDLEIQGGVGKSSFDLRTLQPKSLTINGGTGEINLTLPAWGELYRAQVSTGVGQTNVVVPAGAVVELVGRIGTGEFNLEIGEGASVNARLSGGVGACNIRLAEGAAARLEVRTGLGGVSVAPRFMKLSGSSAGWDQNGVWQTANYEDAERRVTLHYEAGIGGFSVK